MIFFKNGIEIGLTAAAALVTCWVVLTVVGLLGSVITSLCEAVRGRNSPPDGRE